MRYIKFYGGTCFCGEDFEDYVTVADNTTDEELDQEATDRGRDNAESYEDIARDYCIDRDDYDSDEEYEEALDDATEAYWEEVYSGWEELTREEFLENGGVEE